MTEPLWYQDGLKFQCTHCGDCCTGAPGFVWITKDEIAAIAAALSETDLDRFERLYVRQVGARRSLREFPNGDCVFFDGAARRCQVYAARPRQCRTWPFWASNLRTPASWRETREACPGCDQGRRYPLVEIASLRDTVRV